MSFSNTCRLGWACKLYFTRMSRCDTPRRVASQSGRDIVRILNWMRGKNPFSFPSDKGKSRLFFPPSLSRFQSLSINPHGCEGSIKPVEEVSLIDTGFFPRILQIILSRSAVPNPAGISGRFPPLFSPKRADVVGATDMGCSSAIVAGWKVLGFFVSPAYVVVHLGQVYWLKRSTTCCVSVINNLCCYGWAQDLSLLTTDGNRLLKPDYGCSRWM